MRSVTEIQKKPEDNQPEPTITIVNRYADDIPLKASEVAKAMRVSRWTLHRWRVEGYNFEFGNRLTTVGHLKNWLRQRALRQSVTNKEAERQDAVLGRLK